MAQVRKLTGTHPWPLSSGRREVHKQPADEHIRLPANTTETTIQHHGKKQVFASRVIITLRLVQNYFLELAASFCGVLQRVLLLLLSLFLLIFFFFFLPWNSGWEKKSTCSVSWLGYFYAPLWRRAHPANLPRWIIGCRLMCNWCWVAGTVRKLTEELQTPQQSFQVCLEVNRHEPAESVWGRC